MRLKRITSFKLIMQLLILCIFSLGVLSISNKVFYPVSSNMGYQTDYYMSFTTDQTYSFTDLNIKLSIPIQYNLSQITNDMECYISLTGLVNTYSKMPNDKCFTQQNSNTSYSIVGDIIIMVDVLSSTTPLHFVFRNILNPVADSSSYFGVEVRTGTHLLQSDRQFKMLTFTPYFVSSINGISITTNPMIVVVGQGTTYFFKFQTDISTLTSTYDIDVQNMEIRVVFPFQYSSSNAICSMMQLSNITGTYAAIQVETTSTPSKSYSIECKKIRNIKSSYMYLNPNTSFYELYLKIENIQNPVFSDTFSNFAVEISRGERNQIIEKVSFPSSSIQAQPEQFDGQVNQTHMMRNATTVYYFYFTHDLDYGSNSMIKVSIGNNSFWKINSVNLMFGFTNSKNFTSNVTNTLTGSFAEITNFGLASKELQQIISFNLTSSIVIGLHQVKIQAFINGKLSGTWSGIVQLNSTWGSFNMLHFSAVQQPAKLPVGKTGPLEFTLFLNYELPQSQNIQNGSMIFSFTPPIATPDPDLYGKVKCYFKATMQAADCIYDNSDLTKTKVTIISPPYSGFQYSQIPIIITTEGGIDQNHEGLTISPVVERYKFDVEFYLYNSSVIPSEVLYTNWLADAIELPNTMTATSLSWQCNQLTALHFNFVTPLMITPQERMIFQFIPDSSGRSAWNPTLGYNVDTVYKQFPCVVVGLPGQIIQCDLYTYVNTVGPYNKIHINSKSLAPFFMLYGFTTPVTLGSSIQIYFPGIRISNNLGAQAIVSFSILQQTPGDTEPYIELYHQNVNIFQTIPAPNIALSPSVLNPTQIQVQTSNIYSMTWNPVSNPNVAYVRYDFAKELPSMNTFWGACTGTCYSSGYPNNWIVEIPASGAGGSVTSPYTLTTSSPILAMPYINSLVYPAPVHITTYSANGQTLEQIDIVNEYIPQPISGTFTLLDPTGNIYSGLKEWYSVGFTSAVATTSTYPFITLKLSQQLQFADPQQCSSTTIVAFNVTGIKCSIIQGTNNHEMLVYNIQGINPGTAYDINVRLRTTASNFAAQISPTVDVYVHHNQSIVQGFDPCFVEDVIGVGLNPTLPIKTAPDEFIIDNPQILNEEIRVNYIGRMFIDFQSSASMVTNLKITFLNHRYNSGFWNTQHGPTYDPMVCLINGKRFYCQQTYNPLVITINSAQITLGSNRLQLDTQYVAPYNGIVFPAVAGNYEIRMETTNPITNLPTTQHTFYVYVHPPELEDIEIASIVKDINTESVYLVNFTIADLLAIPLANHAAGTYSRIFIEFPTIVNGQRVFQDNLGGYQGVLNERVGCSFLNGAQYVLPEASSWLQCRLIPPQIPGAPVKVEVINFDAFSATVDSLGLFIFKVWNPVTAFDSFQIAVKINNYDVVTGHVFPIFQSDYVVFLDPNTQNMNPVNKPSTQGDQTDFFDTTLDVGDSGTIKMTAQTINAGTTMPFYMLVKLPQYLPIANEQLTVAFPSCPISNFVYCVSSPDVNYALVKAFINSSSFTITINDYPLGISQTDSKFESMIIESGRWTGNIEYTISANKRWLDIRGLSTFGFIEPVGLSEKLVTYKERFHVEIQFTTTNYIPATGTVEICFPTSVTKIYPYCRSAFANGSQLVSQSGSSGEIGCDVQNTNHWVITGFAAVPPASIIMISGYIDLPTIPGPLGLAQIITYADTNPTNIYANGSQIDYIQPNFNLIVGNGLAMNPNENVFLTQRDVIRVGSIADFRILFKLPATLTTTGSMRMDFSKKDINGKGSGFTYTPLEIKVCQFIDITTQTRIGCQVTQTDLTSAGESYVSFTMTTFQNLSTTATYELRLTTQKYSYPAVSQGIRYPTVPSTYKIETNIKYSSSSSQYTNQHLYMDVYGPEFDYVKITQYNYIQNEYNPYWFEITPNAAVPITTKHQIIIEFPTLSNDGIINLFSYNLGLSQHVSGDVIEMDIFDSTIGGVVRGNDFMKCVIHHGNNARGIPVKVVCGSFLVNIVSPDTLRFAIAINNPIITSSQISVPISIYSADPYLFTRTQFNLVNGAGYIFDKPNKLSKLGYPSTLSNQQQYSSDQFYIGDAHTNALQIGDAYVIKFNFPIRVNAKFIGGCFNKLTPATVYGDAYYHQNIRTVVCKITAAIPAQLTPTAATLGISGFYTPWYYLTTSEQSLYAIAHYYSLTSSEVVVYTDPFPNLPPRWAFTPYPTITMTSVLLHNTMCQRDDYIFTIQLEPTGVTNINLQYTRLIGIVFPLNTTIDFQFFGRDCIEHTSSQIQVRLCEVNQIARTIYIEIIQGVYLNSKQVVIQTKGLAIRNPCLYPAFDLNQLTVNFFSWQNITASDKRANNRVYMTMNSINMQSVPSPYNYEVSNVGAASTNYFYPFDWVDVPNEKYFNEFYQFKSASPQYSPFKFDLMLTTAIAAQSVNSPNSLTLYYGPDFDIPSPEDYYINDMRQNTELCYLRNTRVTNCVNNFINKQITMYFSFALPVGEWINVYFSIQNPQDLELNGFQYKGSYSDMATDVTLQLQQNGTANSYFFKANPFIGKQTNENPSLTTMPQRTIIGGSIDYGNSLTSQMNIIDITLSLNDSSIKGLKFQIPLVDQFGVQIFSNPNIAFFGLNDGEEYPCGNNDPLNANSGKAKCYIFNGDNANMGQPTTIIFTDFKYTTQIRARFLMKNPADAGKWVTINVKAFKGISGGGQSSLIGHQYVGYWLFPNIFQTILGTAPQTAALASTTTIYPAATNSASGSNNPLWMNTTTWVITGTTPTPTVVLPGQYIIFEAYLNNYDHAYTEPQFCKADFSDGNIQSDDMMIYKSRTPGNRHQKVFFVKKWAGTNWLMQYFKCKHYLAENYFKIYYHASKVAQEIWDYTFAAPYTIFDYTPYAPSTIKYYQMMNDRVEIQIDISTAMSLAIGNGFNWEYQVNYVMKVTTDGAMPFTGISSCFPVGGFSNKKGKTVSCSIVSTSEVVIHDFNEILKDHNGLYSIRVDVITSGSSLATMLSTASNVFIYASAQAYNVLQNFFQVTSPSYTRQVDLWPTYTVSGSTSSYSPAWPLFTAYSNYYQAQKLTVSLLQAHTTGMILNLIIKVAPSSVSLGLSGYDFVFRFYLEGINAQCGTITLFNAQSNLMGSPVSLLAGVTCAGKNYFHYQTYIPGHSYALLGVGTTFDVGQFITFNIQMTTANFDPSYTRDWIGAKVFFSNTYQITYCCGGWVLGLCVTTCYQRYYLHNSYGEGYLTPNQLFAGGVVFNALSYLSNTETQLEIIMRSVNAPISSTTTNKYLLFQFNTGSTVLFPYVNNTGLVDYPIECNCLVSAQSDFSGATTYGTLYNTLECYLKFPQGANIYTSISVNLNVSVNSYAKCYFPGFSSSGAFTVTAKLSNKGVNQANYPAVSNIYGSVYQTLSSLYTFSLGAALNPVTITETPQIYSGATAVTIETNYNTMGGYSLIVDMNSPNLLTTPTFYINFQKAGPIPETTLCTGVFEFCRVYSKYRNILVAKSNSTATIQSVTFSTSSLSVPVAKQPNLGSDYNMIVYVKGVFDSQYTFGNPSYARTNPGNLFPSSTTFSVFPDRLTSTNYQSFTSNLVLSFKLQGHQLDPLWSNQAKIQISYNQAGYIAANKGCIVSTDSILDDGEFSFFCEIDIVNQVIRVENRYYNRAFSASGLIQVVVGVVNQAASAPVTFTLKMYKWWRSANDYGLLIQSSTTYTPFTVGATQLLQSRNQMRQYPFYTRYYSDVYAPFRMAFKFPPTLTTPLTFANVASFFIFDDFQGIGTSFNSFECYLKEFSSNPLSNIQPPQTNGYRNYRQNTQYFFVPTYCSSLNSTALKIQIPRNRDLNNAVYYELVIMPINSMQTGFNNVADALVKLVAFPATSAQHIVDIKVWKKYAFALNYIWIVTTRSLEQNALQLSFTTNFPNPYDFPDHYIEVVFNNLDLSAISPPYNQMGETVPCSFSSAFGASTLRKQATNCIVTYVDMFHQVIKIRVQHFKAAGSTFQLSFDYFFLPSLINLLEMSNTFTVCMTYWSTQISHERCFGQIFIIDGITNTAVQSLTSSFLPLSTGAIKYGFASLPTMQVPYPVTTTSQRNEKIMIKITGGYSAVNPAPLSFSGSTVIWYNPMINLYVQKLLNVASGTNYQIIISKTSPSLRNPFPYEMASYSLGNIVELSFFSLYQPNTKYTIAQTPYSVFQMDTPLVFFGGPFSAVDDIKVMTTAGTETVVKIPITITQSYANLALHQNNIFEIQFDANVVEVKRCWVNSGTVEYSVTTVCTPKPSDPLRLQLLNFYSSNTNFNLVIYTILKISTNTTQITSHLYASNGQEEFTSTNSLSISSVATSAVMPPYNDLSWTESHYTPGYYEQIITPLTHFSPVDFMYFSIFLPENLVEGNSIFTIILNSTLTIQPKNFANTRLICQWMQVNKYGRMYFSGKFSHCIYASPNIVINAPLLNLPQYDSSGNRIPYLLKIREQSPTGTAFTYPQTSQVEEIVLQSATGGILKTDTLRVLSYEHFNGMSFKHTTLTVSELDTYTVQFAAPLVAVGVGIQYVLTLELQSKYMIDTLDIQNIYIAYGDDSTNSTIVSNNLKSNLLYHTLPNKWINGIPYSCWTLPSSSASQTCVQKSTNTIRINLLLPVTLSSLTWKIPLLRNPSTIKPFRMNLTLWSYPPSTSQGHKQLFYQIINQHITKASLPPTSIIYRISAAAQAGNRVQTSTNSMNVQFPAYFPSSDDIIEMKLLSKTVGMINYLSFLNLVDPTYTFYFFQNVNFLIAEKKPDTNLTNNLINIGVSDVSNIFADEYGYEWLNIDSVSTTQTTKKGGLVKKNMPPCTVSPLIYTLMSGKDNIQASNFEVMFTFTTACIIPANSTLRMKPSTSDLEFINFNDQTYCESTLRSQDCWVDSATQNLLVRFDESLAAGPISVTTFARSKSRSTVKPISGEIYAIPQNTATLVDSITAPTDLLPMTSISNLSIGSVFPLLIKPLYENTYSIVTGTFTPGNHLPFTFVELISPFSKLMNSNEAFYYQANTTTSPYATYQDSFELNWIKAQSQVNSNFDSMEVIPPNGINLYGLVPFIQYRFMMGSMYQSTDLNNFLIGPVGAYYNFQYLTDNQIAYYEVYPLPVAEIVTVINPLTQVGEETVLGIRFTSTLQAILPGDKIEIQLDSFNLIQDMYSFTSDQPQCIEFIPGILTSNPSLVCQVIQYPNSASNTPLLMYVYPTNNVAANQVVEIWISPVINSPNILVAGVTIKVLRFCSGEQLCTMYEGRGWYQTTNSMIVTNYGTNGATFTPSPTTVLQTLATHSYNFNSISLMTSFIKYPQNYDKVMSSTCTSTGTCLIFPKQRKVVTVTSGIPVATTSLILNGMTNGIYEVPQKLIDMKLSSSTNLDKYTVIHPPLTTRQVMPLLANAPNTFTITNTQNSGGIFLRNYWNTVKMEIKGLYTSEFVHAFYIVAPPEVTQWDNSYCNATIGAPSQLPYPTRLQCLQITSNTIQIKIPQGVSYQPGISQTETLTIYAKFWLQDFPLNTPQLYIRQPVLSGNFNGYGSFSLTSFSSNYYITQAFTPIWISQHKTPYISQVAFNTESFEERMASINESTTFDILIDPLTTDHVGYIELIVPEEFRYPNVLNHDNCQLIYRTTTALTSCVQTRRDNQTIITINIDALNYDDGPRILRIASQSMSNWFIAPNTPGSLYNMTISLYSPNGTLIEKQSTMNSSRIKGMQILLGNIHVQNGKDELQEQIYDITIKIGSQPIKQGYRGILAKGDYYSEIRVNFESVQGYEDLLGGYYNNLDHIGCVTSLISINKEISCIFDMGTDINDEPTIIVSNYEQIEAETTIKLSFANIKNLPSTLRNTLGISVKYYKVGDETPQQLYSYMMYDHEEAIAEATTPLNPLIQPTSLTISYPGQTIVNEPTTFQIVLTPSVAITDYIVVKFPKDGLRDEYERFNIQCTGCGDFEIFYRADVLRIYLSSSLFAGQSITFAFTGFPSTEYVVEDPAYPITFEGYSGLKIVQHQVVSINLKMQGCKLNSGIIASTSPYGGDTGVIYTFEAQVNVSQLTRADELKQINMMIKLPSQSAWFTPSSYCKVDSPLICIIDTTQKRIVIKNLISYNKATIQIKTYELLNPSTIMNETSLTFTSTIFEETSSASTEIQQNTICLGSFAFTYLPSTPNNCIMTLSSQHESTIKQNLLSFGIVCQEAIRDGTIVYLRIPTEMKFNNFLNTTYNCWTNNPSILLDSRCQIVFINGSFYMKTMSGLNIVSNVLEINLNVVVNNPLSAGTYRFSSTLQHSGNFYSITNNASLTFYSTQVQPQLNTSITLSVIPKQASAEAIYVLRVPTQVLGDQMMLNFGNFGIQMNENTKISYYQPVVNSTQTSLNSTDWLDSQSYFSLLQQTYSNLLSYTTRMMYDLSLDIAINTRSANNNQSGWTYIMLSPIINPSSSSTDNLALKILDNVQSNSSTYNTLVSSQIISMNLNIEEPPSNIYQTQYSVVDNDILSSTVHTITFTLDHQLFSNQNGTQNVQFVIDPPIVSISNLQQVGACLYYPNLASLIECQPCQIGEQQLSFKPLMANLTFNPEISFTLVLSNITNPENETSCSSQSATLRDYLASWFKLKIFVDQELKFQSVYVGMIDNSNKPCVQFKNRKGDILNNLLQTISAGFETPFNISITQPTANLRVFLSTNDTDLTFSSSIIYFNSYDTMFIQLRAIASPNAVNKSVGVTITHQESNVLNSFREPQPFVVKIVAGKKQTVTINEMQSSSVGYDIRVPIILSKSSLNNMSLLLTVFNSTALSSYIKFFTITPLQVPILSLTNLTYFTVRYNGTKVPPTLNISLKLISQNTLTHYLLQQTIYLYFSIDPKYQTLPPVMRMNVLWSYKSNNDLVSKTVYYCCGNGQNTVNYDYLKPVIIDQKVNTVISTKAQISIWTRNQATLYYQLREKGTHFQLENKTTTQLRQDSLSLSIQTFRNSSKIVNAYQTLNFSNLEHETDYYLFVSAFDAFGDSENVTIVMIRTGPLSSAIKFNLNCFQVQTDEVIIVRAIADILKIDMKRIKVVSSEKNLEKTFTLNADNKPVYSHEIVISPSLTDDSISPEELFKTLLLNNPKNQEFLKEKIPSWTGTFDSISKYQTTKPFYEIDRHRSGFKQAPFAKRISYYNVSIGVKLWTKGRVSAVILVEERKTPDNSIDFINKKPTGNKISQLSSSEQQLSPDNKQIYKGLNQYNQKLESKYTFTGLTNQDGEGVVFFKGLKPGSYCKVYITSTNPEIYEPTASLLNAEVYMIEFNMMWNPNLKGDDHLILDSLKNKNPKMFEVITQYNANENNQNKKLPSLQKR